jgi:hypothetical protein
MVTRRDLVAASVGLAATALHESFKLGVGCRHLSLGGTMSREFITLVGGVAMWPLITE